MLTMPGKVDSLMRNMHIHQVIDDSALNVTLVLVHEDLLAGVEDLQKAKHGLLPTEQDLREVSVTVWCRRMTYQRLVQGLVHLFVVPDARFEVPDHLGFAALCVVRTIYFYLPVSTNIRISMFMQVFNTGITHLSYVVINDVFLVTQRLHEKEVKPIFIYHSLVEQLAALAGGVGGVEDGHLQERRYQDSNVIIEIDLPRHRPPSASVSHLAGPQCTPLARRSTA